MAKPRNPNWKLPSNQIIPDKRNKIREEEAEALAHCEARANADDGQPSWEQEWQDFGEVYDDEPTHI